MIWQNLVLAGLQEIEPDTPLLQLLLLLLLLHPFNGFFPRQPG